MAIYLANLLLRVITLGVYHFWAKTRVRAYVWSQTALNGEQFEYTGRGVELFFGYLIAMTVVMPLVLGWRLGLITLLQQYPLLAGAAGAGFYGIFAFLAGFGKFSSLRYQASRTRWRGIRFALKGSATRYGFNTLGYGLLSVLSLGFLFPLMQVRQMELILGSLRFGESVRFRSKARAGALLRRYAGFQIGLLGVVAAWSGVLYLIFKAQGLWVDGGLQGQDGPLYFVFALYSYFLMFPLYYVLYAGYKAEFFRHMARHTSLETAPGVGAAAVNLEAEGLHAVDADAPVFQLGYSTRSYLGLQVTNLLLMGVTLGLAFPLVVVRTLNFICTHLRILGTLDLDHITQSAIRISPTGEGLAEAFDLGSI